MTIKFVTMTREEIKSKMMFDTKENIKMFKSVCEEILNEACSWKYNRDEEYWETGCGTSYVFYGSPTENAYLFCQFCGKTIEEYIQSYLEEVKP